MPTEESKGGSESKRNDNYAEISELVQGFAQLCTSESFAAGLADFESEHCQVFRKWDADDEQDLEWTNLHGKYVALVERMMEDYCQEQDASTESLFKELSELTDNTVVSEFLPQVLMNTDYVHFASQMKLAANNDRAKDQALSAMDEKKGFNLSGVYHSNPDFKLDKEKWGRFLEAAGCPWAFRKLMVKTAGSIKDVYVLMDEDTMEFNYKMPFFGTRSLKYQLDNKTRKVMNPWKSLVPQRAYIDYDNNEVVVMLDPHPHLGQGGYSKNSFLLRDIDGDKVLVWHQYIADPTQDLEQESEMCFWPASGKGGSSSRK